MKKITFKARLSSYEYKWHLKPIDKSSEQFIPESFRGKYVSFLKVFEKFKDGDTLKITIQKEKVK